MISLAGKFGAMGLCGSTIAATSVVKPKTQKGEHNLNKFSTAIGLGTLAATPYLAKQIVNAHPKTTIKIAHKTGAAIEKGTEYAVKYGKKAVEYAQKAVKSETGSKVAGFVQKAFSKVKHTKIGKSVIDTVSKIGKGIASNNTVQKVATKAAEALQKFAKSSAKQKGAYALGAAGVALLAYAGLKKITNYYKKEGAIDQKYDDLHKKYERMIEIDPITNAQTGEPISFEEYCKLAQTMVK